MKHETNPTREQASAALWVYTSASYDSHGHLCASSELFLTEAEACNRAHAEFDALCASDGGDRDTADFLLPECCWDYQSADKHECGYWESRQVPTGL